MFLTYVIKGITAVQLKRIGKYQSKLLSLTMHHSNFMSNLSKCLWFGIFLWSKKRENTKTCF